MGAETTGDRVPSEEKREWANACFQEHSRKLSPVPPSPLPFLLLLPLPPHSASPLPSSFSLKWWNTLTENNLGKKAVYFSLHFQNTVHHRVDIKAGISNSNHDTHSQEQRDGKEFICFCLLVLSLISSLLYNLGSPCLRNGATHSGLCLPTSIYLRQSPTDKLIGQPNGDHSSLRISSHAIQVDEES